jgi:hypothetical protein
MFGFFDRRPQFEVVHRMGFSRMARGFRSRYNNVVGVSIGFSDRSKQARRCPIRTGRHTGIRTITRSNLVLT